jgi:predicted transcriptional regulator
MAKATATIRMYIKAEQHARLRELAGGKEFSVRWLIRRAIDEYLARHEQVFLVGPK